MDSSKERYRWFTLSLLFQQAIGTIWFWWENIHDQIHANGCGESTASWLGGGFFFLLTTAWLQWRLIHKERTKKGLLLFIIQALSTLGNGVAFSIFAYRRWSWSTADSLCLAIILSTFLFVVTIYCYCHRKRHYKENLYIFICGGWGIVLLAIELRSIPRFTQGISLFLNNTIGFGTVLSGFYIAIVRLMAVGTVCLRSSTVSAKHAWYAELIGNMGSQVVLSVGWFAASIFAW